MHLSSNNYFSNVPIICFFALLSILQYWLYDIVPYWLIPCNIDHHKLMIFLANRRRVSLRLYLPQERAAASYECLRRGIYAATIKENNDVILSNFIILRAGGLPRVTLSRRWSVALQCTRFTSRSGSAARHEILSPLALYEALHLCGAGVPFFLSPSPLYRNILPANVSSSTGPAS